MQWCSGFSILVGLGRACLVGRLAAQTSTGVGTEVQAVSCAVQTTSASTVTNPDVTTEVTAATGSVAPSIGATATPVVATSTTTTQARADDQGVPATPGIATTPSNGTVQGQLPPLANIFQLDSPGAVVGDDVGDVSMPSVLEASTNDVVQQASGNTSAELNGMVENLLLESTMTQPMMVDDSDADGGATLNPSNDEDDEDSIIHLGSGPADVNCTGILVWGDFRVLVVFIGLLCCSGTTG